MLLPTGTSVLHCSCVSQPSRLVRPVIAMNESLLMKMHCLLTGLPTEELRMRGGRMTSNSEETPEGAQRVLVVISSLGGGGAERVVVDLCEFLANEGRHVILLTLDTEISDHYQLSPTVERQNIHIMGKSRNIFESLINTIKRLIKIRTTIVKLQPHTVVSFVDLTNIRILAALFRSGIPTIISERIHPAYHDIGRIWHMARRLTYPLAGALVVQTGDAREWASKHLYQRKTYIIPNAVRLRKFSNVASSKPLQSPPRLILAVGRLNRQKGFDLLIEAFRRSGLAEKNWQLIILGEGDERGALEDQISSSDLGDAVGMPGYVENVAQWYAKAELFVLSSRYEGFPNALLEAMQFSLACIAFDCPSGPSDIIEHGKNGWLVPGQDEEALTKALVYIADSIDLRPQLGRAAIEVRQRFSPDTVYLKWSKLIDNVYLSNQSRHN